MFSPDSEFYRLIPDGIVGEMRSLGLNYPVDGVFLNDAIFASPEVGEEINSARVICMAGLPGSGGSGVTRAISTHWGVRQVLSTDEFCRQAAQELKIPRESLYTPENMAIVYKYIARQVALAVSLGKTIVDGTVDGTFLNPEGRQMVIEAVGETGNTPLFILVVSLPDAVRQKISGRSINRWCSEATFADYLKMKKRLKEGTYSLPFSPDYKTLVIANL